MTTSGGPEKTVEGRIGFQRLVAEVSLGHVGLVFGIKMSRLARSCRDWHQLLEICALFNTLIADPEAVYDPGGCYNDRLLLGLKATMSEAELHILEARMAKARGGELGKSVRMGYMRRPSRRRGHRAAEAGASMITGAPFLGTAHLPPAMRVAVSPKLTGLVA
jgi:DNA invertase Pin-like site-specific DNA recombinase